MFDSETGLVTWRGNNPDLEWTGPEKEDRLDNQLAPFLRDKCPKFYKLLCQYGFAHPYRKTSFLDYARDVQAPTDAAVDSFIKRCRFNNPEMTRILRNHFTFPSAKDELVYITFATATNSFDPFTEAPNYDKVWYNAHFSVSELQELDVQLPKQTRTVTGAKGEKLKHDLGFVHNDDLYRLIKSNGCDDAVANDVYRALRYYGQPRNINFENGEGKLTMTVMKSRVNLIDKVDVSDAMMQIGIKKRRGRNSVGQAIMRTKFWAKCDETLKRRYLKQEGPHHLKVPDDADLRDETIRWDAIVLKYDADLDGDIPAEGVDRVEHCWNGTVYFMKPSASSSAKRRRLNPTAAFADL